MRSRPGRSRRRTRRRSRLSLRCSDSLQPLVVVRASPLSDNDKTLLAELTKHPGWTVLKAVVEEQAEDVETTEEE